MGGQLSCVSCKNRKESNSNAKTKKKSESQPPESHIISNVKYSPVTSGWELYQILQRSNGRVQKGEEKMSDIEKVARAIVEINVYLASQVIYPALEKYLREDQQKSDVKEVQGSDYEDDKQRFSGLPQNEGKPFS